MGSFGAKPSQVQQGSGGFGAEPGQVQPGSEGGSGEGLGGRARQVQQGSGECSGEDLGGSSRTSGRLCVQSQVKFNKALEKVRSGSNRFRGFPALGFAARFRKMCKKLRLLGIPPKLIQNSSVYASQEEKGQISKSSHPELASSCMWDYICQSVN